MLTIGTVFNIAGILFITGGLADRGRDSFWWAVARWLRARLLRPMARLYSKLRAWVLGPPAQPETVQVGNVRGSAWLVHERSCPDQQAENAALWNAVETLGDRVTQAQRECDLKIEAALLNERGGSDRRERRYLRYAVTGAALCCTGAVFSLIGSGAR